MNTTDALVEKFKAGYPAIYLQSYEDDRTIVEIMTAAKQAGRKFYIWRIADGLKLLDPENKKAPTKEVANTEGPEEVIQAMKNDNQVEGNSVIVLVRMHHWLGQSPVVQQGLISAIKPFKKSQKTVILMSPVTQIPPELMKDLSYLEVQLPTRIELEGALDGILTASKGKAGLVEPDQALRRHLIDAALGLTMAEAQNAFALSLVRTKGKWDPSIVMDEKCQSLKKTGLLTYYPPAKHGLESIGGFKAYKEWIRKRKKAFTDEARAFGLSVPKGVLLVGPPGTGKSVGAKATAKELDLALLRVDMGSIFGGLVGESEKNARIVIQTAEAVAPCVLWIDELEKGFAGSSSSLDSGVGARVLGTFLTWMTEKTASVFTYATANDVTSLPPELLRKGRFDELWSVNLPTEAEIKEIFAIHMKQRGRDVLLGKMNIDVLATKAVGFSGSEIEAAIEEAMFTAFDNGRDLIQSDIINALDETTPLSITMKDQLIKIEEWCKKRTRKVNEAVEAPTGDMLPAHTRKVMVS